MSHASRRKAVKRNLKLQQLYLLKKNLKILFKSLARVRIAVVLLRPHKRVGLTRKRVEIKFKLLSLDSCTVKKVAVILQPLKTLSDKNKIIKTDFRVGFDDTKVKLSHRLLTYIQTKKARTGSNLAQ